MTAAHPTLSIPSYARVTNVKNGRSVIVRVNDRGPFHKGRVMDLSFLAACRLGYANNGSAEVIVESLMLATRRATLLPTPKSPFIAHRRR
ncbi:septal ring lytic transglycosylase RlpA family protein [Deefgea piscis]|uniref:septal ring lytic transglycosylase RlpA family protein n=1 Tax=Deefgea piscis TaxID=2739061 RepID=UPI0027E4FD45|nr:septal ring lytic transglycosylase RlpA family protein [Deefgea piscis]